MTNYPHFQPRTGEKYRLSLDEDEAKEGMRLMERASETADKLSDIIDNCDKLTISKRTLVQAATHVPPRKGEKACPMNAKEPSQRCWIVLVGRF